MLMAGARDNLGAVGGGAVELGRKRTYVYARPKHDMAPSRKGSHMHRLLVAALGVAVLTAPGAAFALGGEAIEVESARMNALAGGPTNARDAELLERYGGTPSAVCHETYRRHLYHRHRRAYR
jgi:hypothetical protein